MHTLIEIKLKNTGRIFATQKRMSRDARRQMLYLLYVTAPSNTQSIQSVEFGQSIEMDLYKEENKERRNRRVEEKTYGYML